MDIYISATKLHNFFELRKRLGEKSEFLMEKGGFWARRWRGVGR